ncbi:phospholipase A [Vibrio sp. SS-MA-C1-2]|uniref:phospholipase A n=1 Tax=Vibrio sp. SS-MA-C1-2 TaxID=2908646 RepID=UPI001F172E87|nr:phospholipase A [Vibrio sp. SS-MA-C1-2]UJF18296.1 phospholipase A [Vibrio sp. SS-MA-C1-2]
MLKRTLLIAMGAALTLPIPTLANDPYSECLLDEIDKTNENITLEQIKKLCQEKNNFETDENDSLVAKRFVHESSREFDPFVITPHKMNYILPARYTSDINKDVYKVYGDGDITEEWPDGLKNTEVKFQVSFKVPLNWGDMLLPDDGLYFAFTIKSWWQLYADDISSPFRETNYQPEVFYMAPMPWKPLDLNLWGSVGFEHESNGRTQGLSRSWNRIYLDFLFEKDNYAFSFKPWWRLPEENKSDPFQSDGDDNPDIQDYMGHFELAGAYKMEHVEFSALGRQNFSEGKGYVELGMTFPLWGHLRGYVQYTGGYGESLIDYDHNQQTVGIGVALTDIL